MAVNQINTNNVEFTKIYKTDQRTTSAEVKSNDKTINSENITDRVEISKKAQELIQNNEAKTDKRLARYSQAAQELMTSANNNEDNSTDILKLNSEKIINTHQQTIANQMQTQTQNQYSSVDQAAFSGMKIDSIV